MNVLQVIPQLDAGGAERTTLEMAEAVVKAGGLALVASEGGRLEPELEAVGGELVRLPVKSKSPWVIWRNAARLAAIVRERGVDIVHARSRAPAWSALWAAQRTGAHFVTTYHGTYNARSGLKRWYNSVMARGERVIANSSFIADHVRREHPEAADRITVIPRGVDLERFQPGTIGQDRIDRLAQAWSIRPGTRKVALYPARLTAWKGHREVLHALGELKREGSDIPLTIIVGDAQGRDAYVGELKALIAEYELHDDVRMDEHTNDMPAALSLADFALTPSIEPEAFGRTAAEAGAMGVPVIAADHGGAREVVLAGETGWRVRPGEVASLKTAIAEAMAQPPEIRSRMGQHAAEHVRANFSTASLQSATLRVYSEVLNSTP